MPPSSAARTAAPRQPQLQPTRDDIGTLAWLRRTEGRLSLRERLQLMQLAFGPATRDALQGRWSRPSTRAPHSLSTLQSQVPDTPAVGRALQAMAETGHTDVLQHSWRTYWWAAAFGQAKGLQADHELLLVACLLHDLGIADDAGAQASGCACFTAHSAQQAMAIARRSDWDRDRTTALGDAIVLHMNGKVNVEQGVEAHLLQCGTACDVIGARLARLPMTLRQQVLQAHPRGDFDAQFIAFLAREHQRHPESRAAWMHQLGVGWMVRFNPF